jgi:hypothetical protein
MSYVVTLQLKARSVLSHRGQDLLDIRKGVAKNAAFHSRDVTLLPIEAP